MAYIVINNNNKQSYTLRNTANKPRVVLKSNGTSYIPLKAGTDTRATRLGFNINGNHYKAGGETSTTSIQSNTTYTYFGAQTYRTSTYLGNTTLSFTSDIGFGSSTFRTTSGSYTNAAAYNDTRSRVFTSYNEYYRITEFVNYTTFTRTTWVSPDMYYYNTYLYAGPYGSGPLITVHATGTYQGVVTATWTGTVTSMSTSKTTGGPYGVTLVTQYIRTNYSVTFAPKRYGVKYCYYEEQTTNTSSYDYGYNVEVGNTTTTVQTTTEV